ncbi:chalcone-flavanone isomerase-domain-containing protein [Suillus paluster]|uniref:chalcone-flavanone isomerase-domain-containing protein n=1 Tax=Suillus paluster TaxID=48578 RepID=UPI001B879A3C|nr:chalcone-flavanone isomerase-domain-containing protein [Suillus paluster]KAG1755008.1 chalcone-flavanone isomerase-domain-containing protein [Suillus paluster]
MSQFLRPLALFSASWSRSYTIGRTRTLKQSRSCIKPLLWGAVSVFSAAYAVQSTATIHLDAEPSLPDSEFETDPATSIAFPKTLRIPSKFPLPQFSLVGVGVRTVSFLGIKVYSVGFYADLANPNLNIPVTATPDEKIEHIVRNTACVLRIVPTRSTSYSHLRDGFMRALTARMQLAHARATITPAEEAAAQSPLRELKSLFPTTALSKGTALDVVLVAPSRSPSRPRSLIFRDMGSVENDWVAEEFVLAYFEGNGISPPLKKTVAERVRTLGK